MPSVPDVLSGLHDLGIQGDMGVLGGLGGLTDLGGLVDWVVWVISGNFINNSSPATSRSCTEEFTFLFLLHHCLIS